MAEPNASAAAASVLQGPLGPLLMLALGPAIAAGWGADQAIQRAGASGSAVMAAVETRVAPLADDVARLRTDVSELVREVRELRRGAKQ